MKLSRLSPALALLALAGGCSAGAVTITQVDPPPTSPPDASTSESGADSGAIDSGSTDSAVNPTFEADPKNCGAKGHDCLGRTCSAGLCARDELRTGGGTEIFRNLAVHGGVITTRVDVAGANDVIRRGPSTPGAADTVLATLTGAPQLYYFSATDDSVLAVESSAGVQRWAVPGGAFVDLAPGGKEYAAGTGEVFFYDNKPATHGVRVVPVAGGASTLVSDAVPGDLFAITSDTTDVYVANSIPDIYRVPKTGGAPTKIAITGLPDFNAAQLALTPTRIVIIGFDYGGSVSCDTSTYAIWSAPRAGGAAVEVMSATGFIGGFHVDGEVAYWQEPTCNGATPKTYLLKRRPVDASTPALSLAKGPTSPTDIQSDAQYMYWLEPLGIFRTPK